MLLGGGRFFFFFCPLQRIFENTNLLAAPSGRMERTIGSPDPVRQCP